MKKLKKNVPPFSQRSGWMLQFLQNPWVGGRNEIFFLSFPHLLGFSIAFGKESQQKSFFFWHIKCPV